MVKIGAAITGMAAVGAATAWRSWREARSLVVETVRVPLPADSGLSGLTVLHLSDVHAHGAGTWAVGALDELRELEPDLVAVTGDVMTARAGLAPVARTLAQLKSRLGTYVVLGNHDHYHGTAWHRMSGAIGPFSRPNEVVKELEAHGLKILLNENLRLETRLGPLQIVGTDDPFFGLDNVEKAYEGVDEGEPVLVLAHSPDAAAELDGRRCDLMLSGHTHGGQLLAPLGLVPGVTNTDLKLPNPYGLMVLEGTLTHVSAGVGTANIPFRFNCPPRATMLEFVEVGVGHGRDGDGVLGKR